MALFWQCCEDEEYLGYSRFSDHYTSQVSVKDTPSRRYPFCHRNANPCRTGLMCRVNPSGAKPADVMEKRPNSGQVVVSPLTNRLNCYSSNLSYSVHNQTKNSQIKSALLSLFHGVFLPALSPLQQPLKHCDYETTPHHHPYMCVNMIPLLFFISVQKTPSSRTFSLSASLEHPGVQHVSSTDGLQSEIHSNEGN